MLSVLSREVEVNGSKARYASDAMHRVIDVVLATTVLVLSTPLLVFAVLAIRLESPGRAIFCQDRVGRRHQVFTIYKLRTMYIDADDRLHREANEREILGLAEPMNGVAYKNESDPRVTRVGRVLRRFSLDELPQMVNVLKGEMAVVGPRPSLTWEAELFPASATQRLDVRPGITGIWQVTGRNNVSMQEMLTMDCHYVASRTIRGDLWIILKTVPAVFEAEGAA